MSPETRYCSECGRATAAGELAQFGDRMVCAYCKQNYAQKLREGVAPVTAVSYAGFWIRVLAVIIDAIIMSIVQGMLQWLVIGSIVRVPRVDPSLGIDGNMGVTFFRLIGLAWLVSVAVNSCYEAFFVNKLGATPGKMALGLKVVRPNGAPVDLGRAFGRYFAKILSGLILGIGFIMVAFDSEKRGLHDIICDTRVVRVRN
jgi:uncharacterized RDD family membrane protein YckC